jgi:hypothetical protein
MGLKLGTYSQQARLLSKNLFQSRQRLTVRCDTTVYSFGKEVVGSMEIKQATYQRDRYIYDFRIVDAWLEEFLRTVRGDGNDEMESSLQNITIVQVKHRKQLYKGATTLAQLQHVTHHYFSLLNNRHSQAYPQVLMDRMVNPDGHCLLLLMSSLQDMEISTHTN